MIIADINFALTEILLFFFILSTIILSLVNYKLNKSLKRMNAEAQYWCEQYVKSNKPIDDDTEKYEDVI